MVFLKVSPIILIVARAKNLLEHITGFQLVFVDLNLRGGMIGIRGLNTPCSLNFFFF